MTKDSPPILRPLNLADLLDQAVSLYRRNFAVFAGITAVVYIPVGIVQMSVGYLSGSLRQGMPQHAGQLPWTQMGGLGIAWLGLLLVSLLAIPLGQGALAIAVSRRYLGEPVTVADAYQAVGNRWGPLILTVLVLGLAAFAGVLLCVIPGIYLGILWVFASPVVVLEGATGPVEAAKRSGQLVGDQWWHCFATYMVLSLLVYAISQAIIVPVSLAAIVGLMKSDPALAQAINQGLSAAASILVQPVLTVGLVLLYYDMRVRREGFDLELLAQALGTTLPTPAGEQALWTAVPPPPPPPPPPAPTAQAHWPGFPPPPGPPPGSPPPEPPDTQPLPAELPPSDTDAALIPDDDDAVSPFNVAGPPPEQT